MKEFFKKESVVSPQAEQWAEFKEKQLRDTNLVFDRIISTLGPDDFTEYTPEDRDLMTANRKKTEEDMAEFKKNKELWSNKLREKEKELGFSSNEWWSPHFNFYVPRDIIDPRRTAKTERNVWKRIELWLAKNGFKSKQVVVSLDVREYPEFIDEGILELVVCMNNLPFIKTLNFCSGHREHDTTSPNTVEGYDSAYLYFVINKNLPHGEEFLQSLKSAVEEFNEPLSEVLVRKTPDGREDDKGTEVYGMEFHRGAPSEDWLEKYRKSYLMYTRIPERQEEFKKLFRTALERNGISATDRAVERLAYDYFDHFEGEYAGYSISDEAKKRTDEFWRRIEEVVNRFSVEHKT